MIEAQSNIDLIIKQMFKMVQILGIKNDFIREMLL